MMVVMVHCVASVHEEIAYELIIDELARELTRVKTLLAASYAATTTVTVHCVCTCGRHRRCRVVVVSYDVT